EEQVFEAAGEHVRRAAGRLDEDHLVLLGDRGGRVVQQRRERAEHQVDLVLRDQLGVVGDDRVLAAGVVDDLELDLPAEQAAVVVDLLLPDLVAAFGLTAGLREVAGERQRDADDDRLGRGGRLLGRTGAAGGQRQRRHHPQRGGAEPAPAAGCGPIRGTGPTGDRERTSAHRALHAEAARGRQGTAIVCCPDDVVVATRLSRVRAEHAGNGYSLVTLTANDCGVRLRFP